MNETIKEIKTVWSSDYPYIVELQYLGILLFSKYPIMNVLRHYYQECNDGYCAVRVKASEPVWIMIGQLPGGGSHRHALIRTYLLDKWIDFSQSILDRYPSRAIVCGDFNIPKFDQRGYCSKEYYCMKDDFYYNSSLRKQRNRFVFLSKGFRGKVTDLERIVTSDLAGKHPIQIDLKTRINA